MKNLLKFEFRKLFKQKGFYVCTAVVIAMSIIGLLLKKSVASNPDFGTITPTSTTALLTAISSSSFTMICGIFIAIFVCTDYDRQTIKNIYSHGFTRDHVYFAKYAVCMLSTAVMFAITLFGAFIVSIAMFGNAVEMGNCIWLFMGQLLYCLAYASFVFAVSLSVKKVGTSIALAVLGTSLVGTIISLIDTFLKIDGFKIGAYWLEGFIGDLSSLATDSARLTICIVLSLVYTATFIIAGLLINRKQEN